MIPGAQYTCSCVGNGDDGLWKYQAVSLKYLLEYEKGFTKDETAFIQSCFP